MQSKVRKTEWGQRTMQEKRSRIIHRIGQMKYIQRQSTWDNCKRKEPPSKWKWKLKTAHTGEQTKLAETNRSLKEIYRSIKETWGINSRKLSTQQKRIKGTWRDMKWQSMEVTGKRRTTQEHVENPKTFGETNIGVTLCEDFSTRHLCG